jgi:hypothetical protein
MIAPATVAARCASSSAGRIHQPTSAQSDSNQDVVWVNPNSDTYHGEHCRCVGASAEMYRLVDARDTLHPCRVCQPVVWG